LGPGLQQGTADLKKIPEILKELLNRIIKQAAWNKSSLLLKK
jgi:hypothetical protein